MYDVWFHIQTENSTHSLVAFVSEKLNFKSLEELQETIKYLTDYQNNIPRWKLKGNVPVSHAKASRRSRGSEPPTGFPIFTGQPGRDDPCLCGSGKKFKKCCGNN
ncbi:MAG: SEC-C metal-binding domain-containing protein [Bacteroidales bacterium]